MVVELRASLSTILAVFPVPQFSARVLRDGSGGCEVSSAPIQLIKRMTPIPAHITDCTAPPFLNYEPVLLSQFSGSKVASAA